MGWTRITRAAHTSTCTIHRLLAGQDLTRRTVVERILAVKARPAPGRYVDATGTLRRIQALMAIGHTVGGIAAESGVDHTVITDLLQGRSTTVRGCTADRVAAAYDWLNSRPNTWIRQSAAQTSRNRAAREGWAPPIAWDDDTIDDPAAQPDYGQNVPRYVAIFEDGLELEGQGYTREQAAERLGITRDYLQQCISAQRAKEAA
jgi:hypothetical protein